MEVATRLGRHSHSGLAALLTQDLAALLTQDTLRFATILELVEHGVARATSKTSGDIQTSETPSTSSLPRQSCRL